MRAASRARAAARRALPALALGLVFAAGRAPSGARPAHAQATEAYVRVATWASDAGAAPPGAFLEPRGLTVDPFDGTVFVVDGGNRRLQVFSADGRFLRSLGEAAGPGALAEPRDVAVQGSLVFVSDPGLGRVALYTVEGDYVGAWEGLDIPWGLAAAADGRVLVAENGANRIAVFRADGRRLATWAGVPGGAFDINRPRGLDVLPDGRLLLVDYGNDRLVALDRDGLPDTQSARLPGPLDVAASPDGALYVACEDGTLRRLGVTPGLPLDARSWPLAGVAGIGAAPDGALFASFQDDLRPLHGVQRWTGRPLVADVVWGGVPAPLGRIDGPTRLVAGADAFVVDGWRRAQRFSADGRAQDQLPVGALNDLALGPGGGLHVVRDGELARLAADGTAAWRAALPATAGAYPWGVAVDWDPAGDQAAVLDLGGQALRRFDGSGRPAGAWSFRPGSGGMALWWDLARAPDGFYVVDRGSDQLEHRAADGRPLGAWPVPGGPVRVASDARGLAYVLNRHGWVLKYGPEGDLRAAWPAGDADRDSSQPSDLTVDAAGRVLVTDVRADEVRVFALDPLAPPGELPSFEPRCRPRGDKRASPTLLQLGEETEISLFVSGDCPPLERPADIVLAIDHSGSMAPAGKLDAAQAAALAFLEAIDFAEARVALVGFNQDARLLQELSANKPGLAAAVSSLVAGGGTDIAEGLDAARGELTGSRRRLAATGVIVLISDGGSDPIAATRAADQAKLEGLRIFTVGFGADAATALLAALASSDADYYFAPDGPSLLAIYRGIASRVAAELLFSRLVVTDVLPDNMLYVNGSGQPEPRVMGQTLVWELADVPLAGLALRYRVQPLEPGTWPTNVVAEGEGSDGLGQRGRVTFPVPVVEVVAGTGTPPPSATPSAVPPPSPTAPPSPSPIPTAGPTVHHAYLPMASRLACIARRQHADVVLVVDSSESMREPVGGGGSKLDAALLAARGFVGLLDLRRDAAAVVAFNAGANLRLGLSQDRGALLAALGGLPQAAGTRIDLGLAKAGEALAGPGRNSGNLAVVVLLTDGRPSGTSDAAVLAEAAALKRKGVLIYAIGLGADVDGALLADIASDAAHLVLAPEADELARIYADIARELPCQGP